MLVDALLPIFDVLHELAVVVEASRRERGMRS